MYQKIVGSRDGSMSHVNSSDVSDLTTTVVGHGTLTSLLGHLLAVGSMDGFAPTFFASYWIAAFYCTSYWGGIF